MTQLRLLAMAWVIVMCAGCAARSWSLYPPAEFGPRPYTALDHARDAARRDAAFSAPVLRATPAPTPLRAPAAAPPDPAMRVATAPPPKALAPPRVRPAAPDPAPAPAVPPGDLPARAAPASSPDGSELFACNDGSVLDVRYSEDGRRASAHWGEADPVELDRDDSQPVLTYSNGSATLRRAGPRVAWETGTAETRVTVRAGDTLSKIALAHYGSFAEVDAIVAANVDRISDPNLIFPGQVLVLPGAGAGSGQTSCRRTLTAQRA